MAWYVSKSIAVSMAYLKLKQYQEQPTDPISETTWVFVMSTHVQPLVTCITRHSLCLVVDNLGIKHTNVDSLHHLLGILLKERDKVLIDWKGEKYHLDM